MRRKRGQKQRKREREIWSSGRGQRHFAPSAEKDDVHVTPRSTHPAPLFLTPPPQASVVHGGS